jgi:hypothetical protein
MRFLKTSLSLAFLAVEAFYTKPIESYSVASSINPQIISPFANLPIAGISNVTSEQLAEAHK